MSAQTRSFDYNRGAFWVGLCALLVSFGLTYLTIQSDWGIATHSGSLRKARLVFGLGGGLPLDPVVKTRVLLGARKISVDTAVVVAGIPFVVSNSGDATLEDITVTFRFHEMFRRDALEQLKFTTTGIFTAIQIQRSFTTNGPLHYSSYLIPGLNPGQTLVGAEPVYLPQTNLDLTVPLETRDKKATNVSMSVEFALEFLASIAAKDMTTRDYHMTLETAEAESLDDLAQRATSRIRRDLGKAREATTFGQYLRALVFGVPDEHLYLVFAELDEHRAGDGTLYFARPDARVRRLSYSPVSWQRLFR